MPNPRFDECAVIEQDTAEGLARACRVISSRDCVLLKNTEFHTELARPAGTGRYWFSNRVEQAGRKCSIQTSEMKRGGRYVRRAAHAGRKDKRASEEMLGPGHWNFISVILQRFCSSGIYGLGIILSLCSPFTFFPQWLRLLCSDEKHGQSICHL